MNYLREENTSYGTRRLSDALNKAGYQAGRDKVRRLMVRLGLEARLSHKNLAYFFNYITC